MPALKPAVIATLALLSAACSGDAVEPTNLDGGPSGFAAGKLDVSVNRGVVRIRNTTSFEVVYSIVERNAMNAATFPVSLVACKDNCPVTVKQGATVLVPYMQILGYGPRAKNAAVMWWRYSRSSDGTLEPVGTLSQTNVGLR